VNGFLFRCRYIRDYSYFPPLHLKVESLFIDEGFGSLDAESLRTAMEALEQLQMQGRKIGVISHVQEMSERISVQVQVHKKVNGKSVLTVVG
jgi:exonuclease SbcC